MRLLLHAYSLPLFVMGTPRILGQRPSPKRKNIIGYIQGNYEEATEAELGEALLPYVNDWKKVKTEDLRLQLNKAADAGKLSHGIAEVWRAASQNRGRLLIVERILSTEPNMAKTAASSLKPKEPHNKFSYIKDAVDDVIEKVLERGGDVEFVDEDELLRYDRIALIQYY